MNQGQHQQRASYSKPAQQQAKPGAAAPAARTGTGSSNSVKVTGLFKSQKGKGYEVKVTEEVAAKLQAIKPGSYLKIYENKSEKTGTEYLSLSVKNLG